MKIPNYLEIFFCFILFLCLCHVGAAAGSNLVPEKKPFPAIIVFGDSIVDPGNNNYIKTLIKCDFPPYGKDFNGGTPTGRFSNGKIPTDFVGGAPNNSFYLSSNNIFFGKQLELVSKKLFSISMIQFLQILEINILIFLIVF